MQILWEDGERVFCRERCTRDGRTSTRLIVLTAVEQPLRGTLDRLTHEYELRHELLDDWAVRPRELRSEAGRIQLVLDDPGGEPLARLIDIPMEPGLFLRLAAGIAGALRKLHQHGLVHKDLKPTHILVNGADGQARFTGFGLASQVQRHRQLPEPPDTIAGSLAYMAPEQTGRMNRSIDSRSDLYSLGVTFYQMLTGSLPFTASDPIEWIHCHLAKKPLPPSERLTTIPQALCQVVMKLLAKNAEERYQTAAGVEHDLQHCLQEWQRRQRISAFVLDEHSVLDRLVFSEKLYGRVREVGVLAASFERCHKQGATELVLVSGYSGIGKSSVVNELHKVLVPARGLLATGKFDQYKRDIPYSTLVQAFQGVVRALLGSTNLELAKWREALLEALGPNAQLITDLIPELKHIIGEPQPVPPFEPQQAQRRFLRVLRRFIGVFAKAEHTLALFLDDLQWVDAATLELIQSLLSSSELGHLMLIGAYRGNEVDDSHPLARKLDVIKGSGSKIEEIILAPLAQEHVELLIADALHCEPANVVSLAKLVQDKTAGNPFFAIQFLHALFSEQLLSFDHDSRQWRWDTRRIHAKGYTDNVVDLMVDRLVRLSSETQEALQQLACLGKGASVATLATVLGVPQARVHAVFRVAVRHEMVECFGDVYAFIHDRIHEAAYSLMSESSRASLHLRIGRLFTEQMLSGQHEEKIFEVVGQLNRGAALITAPDELEQLAQLNLAAGLRAKASTAYGAALTYFAAGIKLLIGGWQSQHALKYALEFHCAECEFLTGQIAAADHRLSLLSRQTEATVERAEIACLHTDVCLLLNRNDRAVSVCLNYLQHVGIEWSAHPADNEVQAEYDQIKELLGKRSIPELIDLAPMKDEVALATIRALITLFSSALHTDQNLACLTVCKAVNISLVYGNSEASCVAYANIPRIAGRRFGDYDTGFQFGRLGCDLVEQNGLGRYEARTFLAFALFVARWASRVRDCTPLLHRAFDAANRVGDLPFAAFSINIQISNQLFAGDPLCELQSEAERSLKYARKVRFGLVVDFIEHQLALIRMFRGLTPVFGCLDDEAFSEVHAEDRLNRSSQVLAGWYWVRKLQACFFAGEYEAAVHAALKAESLIAISHSFLEEVEYHFYGALAVAGLCEKVSTERRQRLLGMLATFHAELQIWSGLCPENFECHSQLVNAEIARIEGRPLDAEARYEQAIDAARRSGFVHIEALANELASHFYAGRGLLKIARVYLQDARFGYLRWGADGKVKQLENAFPFLRSEQPASDPTTTIAAPVENLDLATVLKVSQAVSSDIVLEKLIDMIMRTAIEQAGAERGLLILLDHGEARVVAEAATETGSTQLRLTSTELNATLAPESVLNHVLRSGESVVLDNAAIHMAFAADPYVQHHRVRSVLCLPLMNQARLTGALYLENNLAVKVFNSARITVLKLLASQASISLENARLYREIADREARIRRLVDANIIGIVVWTTGGDFIDANDAFLHMVGYQREDIVSRRLRWRDLTPPEFREISERSMLEAVNHGRAVPFEKEYFRKDGSRLPVIVGLAMFESNLQQGVAFVLDLTERKQAEKKVSEGERRYRQVLTELAHANRVATMGQLAASVAHEVSQPVAATLNNAHAALRWLEAQPADLEEVRQALHGITRDGKRAADVLGRIRGLIRKAPPQRESVSINLAIQEMVELTGNQAAACGVVTQTLLMDDLPSVHGDRIELQQVFLNLIINAFEAMSDVSDGGRELRISTSLNDSGDVVVAVADSGPGFDSKSSGQVFSPFYSTKANGLGMGLSICRTIIEAHGGQMLACSNSPRGAIVQFTVPLKYQVDADHCATPSPRGALPEAPFSGGR
ncbi:AAA family ATPase [Pseudomonas sp. 14P_8.1_Bac3]|uniref:trifunctional serine/threonine-protein kinase/ATP-binding protein/sensor histidine kinase n=1 Tax=Pseudomonas sp. 14P_8.1_Bac3 TaxID=2971621 RepID=UPI0021C67478|nr:trifunctional serine/threonine-protein kinase/ATP-binding protein/sensor histidine kinase [Pseudomonas sp. 14P_8.1_Bac3]MCU1758789.1 AAA family ATPase [Pseudomonas sp. 14P_8.1_Bac3]